jgi:hypothetical protein
VTSQGQPRAVFRRALEHGNLLVAEATAREVGRVSLDEALQLTALIALKQPERGRRVAARWIERYLAEHASVTIDDLVLLASLLQALGGPRHREALTALRDVAARASGRAA